MLMPKRVKHRKQMRGSMKGKPTKGLMINYGIDNPDKPVTAKPAETRMGSGKGSVDYWVAVVKPGRVLFEIAGIPEADAREALRLAMHKLPCKCKIVSKQQLEAKYAEAAPAAAKIEEGGEEA